MAINENGRRRRITKLEATVKQLVNRAASGEARATQLLLALVQANEARPAQQDAQSRWRRRRDRHGRAGATIGSRGVMTVLSQIEYQAALRADFYSFMLRCFAEFNPGVSFLPSWHIELMAAKLQAVRGRRIRRLIINIPPRHLKSLAASHRSTRLAARPPSG